MKSQLIPRWRSRWLALAFAAVVVVPALLSAPVYSEEAPPINYANGEQLFQRNCMACHNETKLVGPPLIEDAAYFVRAGVPYELMGALLQEPVRVKREGSIMPVFTTEQLSDADLNDIGGFIASFEPIPDMPLQMGDPNNGATLYSQTCALCHGVNGEGSSSIRSLAVLSSMLRQYNMPPSAMIGFTNMASRSGSIVGMPAISEQVLSDQDLLDIAAHLWTLEPEAAN